MNSLKSLLILTLVIFTTVLASGQDTVYLNIIGRKCIRSTATTYRIFTQDTSRYAVEEYTMDGILQMKGYSTRNDSLVKDGHFSYYSNTGIKHEEGNYRMNKRVGEWRSYSPKGFISLTQQYDQSGKLNGPFITYNANGSIRRHDMYKDDELTERNCYGIDGKDTTWFEYTLMPAFPGGESKRVEFLRDNVKYPRYALEAGIQGTVYINFIVLKNGKLDKIKILRGVDKVLDDEALRVIHLMPDWSPGRVDGVAVDVGFNMSLKFTL